MKSPMLTAAMLGLILGAAPALAQTEGKTAGETTEQTTQETPESTGESTGESAGGSAARAETATAEPAADYGVETPLAEVDGAPITLGELIAVRRELPQQYQQLPDQVLYDGILEQLVDQYLLAEAAREAGIDERPAVAKNLLNQIRAILADAYLRAETERRVTEETIEALYEERYAEAEPVEEVRAAHILVETEEEAEEIKAKLEAGAEFAELAKEHGTDGTAQRGGDLGWFTHGEMVPQFADAVFAMQPGTVSEPVETDFGWHLIKLEERRMRPAPPLDEVAGELREEAVREAQMALVEKLRAEAKIEMPEMPPPPAAIRADDMLDAAE